MATLRILGYTANEPERLPCALHELRSTLSAPEVLPGFGVAHFVDDRLLLNVKPSLITAGSSVAELVGPLKTGTLIASFHDAEDGGPYKFRQWAFAMHGGDGRAPARAKLLAHLPDFLARSAAGESVAEAVFLRFLAHLHEANRLEDPQVDGLVVADALRRALAASDQSQAVTVVSNGRMLLGAHTGGTLAYSLREGILACQRCQLDKALDPFPVRESHRRFRGVMVAGGLQPIPTGFVTVSVEKVLLVNRKLDVQLV